MRKITIPMRKAGVTIGELLGERRDALKYNKTELGHYLAPFWNMSVKSAPDILKSLELGGMNAELLVRTDYHIVRISGYAAALELPGKSRTLLARQLAIIDESLELPESKIEPYSNHRENYWRSRNITLIVPYAITQPGKLRKLERILTN